jgi:hypothetical protein
MLSGRSAALLCLLLAAVVVSSSACGRVFGRTYEYEEDVTLDLDGSAVININASIASLVALRGLDLDTDPRTRFDDAFVKRIRDQVEQSGCQVERISTTSWYRDGRRFVQIRLDVPDIRRAASCGLLSWSRYSFADTGTAIAYKQEVGAPAMAAGPDGTTRIEVPGVNWDGSEFVAFKLHLPSKITYHNVRDVETKETGSAERGNILTWEQRLSDRRDGVPLVMEMSMERESILRRTLLLFAAAMAAAVLVMGGAIWWTIRRPRRSA